MGTIVPMRSFLGKYMYFYLRPVWVIGFVGGGGVNLRKVEIGAPTISYIISPNSLSKLCLHVFVLYRKAKELLYCMLSVS